MSVRFNNRARIAFYQLVCIGGLAVGCMTALALAAVGVLGQLSLAALHAGQAVCGCQQPLFIVTHHPWLIGGAGIAAAVAGWFFVQVAIEASRQYRLTGRYLDQVLRQRLPVVSPRLERVARSLGLAGVVVETAITDPVVFCYGLWYRRICISSALIERLQKKELIAVLRHERNHLDRHEPLKLFIVSSIEHFFFLPGLKSLAQRYRTLAELAADQAATDNFRVKAPLARALYKIIGWRQPMALPAAAVSYFDTTTHVRLAVLVDTTSIDDRWFGFQAFITIGMALALVATIISLALPRGPLWASTEFGFCALSQPTAQQCVTDPAAPTVMCDMNQGTSTSCYTSH